jgi:hypothetical protein
MALEKEKEQAMKKITLNADEQVIEAAQRYADEHGMSLSELFSRFVLSLTLKSSGASGLPPEGSVTRELTGLISLPNDVSDEWLTERAAFDLIDDVRSNR